ncbi:hypothetical protein VIGAN_09051400 [Vigna angularis var. angularis]|uniref:Uncharacterized protein n=1 Tax=Vigna angularis var. angularis TaxID=157739 RepID=A0A0S3SWM2_PHAAN|nr:hypothetical protein VIGAN_09051400 [Vigna angularis var. angularis]
MEKGHHCHVHMGFQNDKKDRDPGQQLKQIQRWNNHNSVRSSSRRNHGAASFSVTAAPSSRCPVWRSHVLEGEAHDLHVQVGCIQLQHPAKMKQRVQEHPTSNTRIQHVQLGRCHGYTLEEHV